MTIHSSCGDHLLVYDDDTHTYTLNGKIVDSVSLIAKTGFPEKIALTNWKVKEGSKYTIKQLSLCPEQVSKLPKYLLDEVTKTCTRGAKEKAQEAADIGKIVHAYAEAVENVDKYPKQLFESILEQIEHHQKKEKILNCVDNFLKWRHENKDTIIAHEEIVASLSWEYAGRFDRLANRRGKIILSDFKTSSGIYVDQFVQLAGYALAIFEWTDMYVDAIEIVRFGKSDGTFEVKTVSDLNEINRYKEQFVRNIQTSRFLRMYDAK